LRTEIGQAGLRICEELFWTWEIYAHTGDRHELRRRVRLLQRELKAVLREHASKHARYRQSRRFARALLKIWPALWTFAKHPRVHPTNNHAERCLRGAVIYRKLSLGSQSEHGEQRIARLLSAHTTCRLQAPACTPTSSTCSPPPRPDTQHPCWPDPASRD
jgi:transposase